MLKIFKMGVCAVTILSVLIVVFVYWAVANGNSKHISHGASTKLEQDINATVSPHAEVLSTNIFITGPTLSAEMPTVTTEMISSTLSTTISQLPTLPLLPPELNDVIVARAAYFDERPRKSHKNATVILVHVLKKFKRQVKGCEVDGIQQLTVLATTIAITRWIEKHFRVSHQDLIVLCYDMNVRQKSSVSLLFEVSGQLVKVPVKRKGVVMPGKGPEKDEVMVCATGFGEVKSLDNWLTYQLTIGIKFIHLNVHKSFLANINKSDVLRSLLDSGYVNMIVWHNELNTSQVYYYSQSFKYQDCILRYQNVFKYMMIVDFDEYFIPLGVSKKVHYYAAKLFRNPYIGSFRINATLVFSKLKGYEYMAVPADGNITNFYNLSQVSEVGSSGKSIHLVRTVNEVSVHTAQNHFPPYGGVYETVEKLGCYIAHLQHP